MQETIQNNKNSIIPTSQLQEILHCLLLGFDRSQRLSPTQEVFDEKQIYEALTDIILRMTFVLILEDRNFWSTKSPHRSSLRSLFEVLKEENGTQVGSHGWNDLYSIFSVLFEEEYHSKFQPDNSCICDVLQKLLYVNGHAISYSNTEIAFLGTIYEILMEFRIEKTPSSKNHTIVRSSHRRNSGSHYTPRSISQKIVQRTIEPVIGECPTSQDILRIKICDPAMGTGAFLIESCRYLSNRLAEVWQEEGKNQEWKSKEERLMLARCLIAKCCLYGVDKNPKAVQLGRWSLWLAMENPDIPLDYFDHNLKNGDAVVGCTIEQITAFDWSPKDNKSSKWNTLVQKIKLQRLKLLEKERAVDRQNILKHIESMSHQAKRIGDLLVACVWTGGSRTQVQKRIERMRLEINQIYSTRGDFSEEAMLLLNDFDKGEFGFKPFHWELEFPEVFKDNESKGFDAVLGNPPYMGKVTTAASNGKEYIKILQQNWKHAHGQSDLCAFFFLQTAKILRNEGCFGLIATNSIGQGNTRQTGLQHIVNALDIEIYNVTRNVIWPVNGAIVSTSVVHGIKGKWKKSKKYLDGEEASWINSELKNSIEVPDAKVLPSNENLAFQGTIVNCTTPGFVLKHSEAQAFFEKDNSKYKNCIHPYIGGLDLNSSPTLQHSRYIINFTGYSLEDVQSNHPDLFLKLQKHVYPIRQGQRKKSNRELWWLYEAPRPNLYQAIKNLKRCLCCSATSKYLLFGFQPTERVFSHALIVFAFDDYKNFAILQSRIHEYWARSMGSSMKNDPRYTPSSCFQTFPFPQSNPDTDQNLHEVGQILYKARSDYMLKHQVGMTETWNRLMKKDNPYFNTDEIKKIRQKRQKMDETVLQAYNWDDVNIMDDKTILFRLRRLNQKIDVCRKPR